MLKVLELFGGIGACSKALERIGIDFEVVDYVEIDKYAVKSYNAMHNTNFEPQNIMTYDKDLEVDLIMHGSPCQDFSVAGKQAGGDKDSGTRSSLMFETLRIVEKLKPTYVIWENVKNVISKRHKHNFDEYLKYLESLGYTNYWQVLNAKDYGIPQNRDRVFVISVLNNQPFDFPKGQDNDNKINRKYGLYGQTTRWGVYDKNGLAPTLTASMGMGGGHTPMIEEFTFPPKQQLNLKLKDLLEEEVDEKYYLSDKTMSYVLYLNDVQVGTKWLRIKNGTKKGYLYGEEGDGVNLTYPNSTQKRGRVQKQSVATLDTGSDKGVILKRENELRIRKLTPKECWRLMGFDDSDFEKAQKVNSNTQLYKQAGNSIVVNILEEIFKILLKGE